MSDGSSHAVHARWLSVLVPVYRAEKYLLECVASVLGQGDDGVEVVLLDDASPDASGGIAAGLCRDHPGRVRLVSHASNAGLSAARNSLLAHAAGEYVWHLDADDIMLPGAIDGLRGVVECSSPDLVLCDFSVLRARSGLKHRLRGERHRCSFDGGARIVGTDRSRLVAGLMRMRCLQAWSKIARREVWRQAMFPHGRRLMQDVAVMPSLVAATRSFVHVDQPWVGYRRHAASAWSAPGEARLCEAVDSLRELKRGMAALGELDDEAAFAVDYYCLRTLGRLSARLSRRSGIADAVIAPAIAELFPSGMAPTLAACRARGWHLRALRLQMGLRARGS
ncbi:glycosyltransferase family 2 protein [Luteimonas viscosa]|uniref:Glycosyltransferase family 2 protein n=1 Tax=Luteimonas viscosa TaxID=1132694 RepID=A0A5D4XPC1_9GAMM|nr:glycosyltransferase family 2 protein [Luteimonas viscosa]TYT25964.1 glycosyltransferase family 2 protein [Luteimonas viscosa]